MGMSYTEQLSEQLSLVAHLDPVSQAAGTATSEAVDMQAFSRVIGYLFVGVFGASATVDFNVTASATSGGTYAAITGKAITQLLAAGGNNKQASIEVRSSDLPAGKRFVKFNVVVATAATLTSLAVLGGVPAYPPASNQIAGVVQQVI